MTVEADAGVGDQALRLGIAAQLTRRAARRIGDRIPAEPGEGALIALARDLAACGPPAERAMRVRFDPAYPGVTGGVEDTRGGPRLVLACTALHRDGAPAAVVFTTLIAGRPALVSAAPPLAPIPPGWALPGHPDRRS